MIENSVPRPRDTRAVPLTVASTDGLRRAVGRVLTDGDGRPLDIFIDDPETVQALAGNIVEGSFQIKVGPK